MTKILMPGEEKTETFLNIREIMHRILLQNYLYKLKTSEGIQEFFKLVTSAKFQSSGGVWDSGSSIEILHI